MTFTFLVRVGAFLSQWYVVVCFFTPLSCPKYRSEPSLKITAGKETAVLKADILQVTQMEMKWFQCILQTRTEFQHFCFK